MKKLIEDLEFELFISEDTISQRVKEIGDQIVLDFQKKDLLIIGVLNGATIFLSDLIRVVDLPLDLHFIKLSSYKGLKSTGKIQIDLPLPQDIAGRDVLVIEDIVDTGITMDYLKTEINKQCPSSFSIATLLHKSEAFQFNYDLNYVGFEIPNKFVVGYGLDYNGKGRNFPDIYQLRTP